MKLRVIDFVLHLINRCKSFIVMQIFRTGFDSVIFNFRTVIEYQNIVNMFHCTEAQILWYDILMLHLLLKGVNLKILLIRGCMK